MGVQCSPPDSLLGTAFLVEPLVNVVVSAQLTRSMQHFFRFSKDFRAHKKPPLLCGYRLPQDSRS